MLSCLIFLSTDIRRALICILYLYFPCCGLYAFKYYTMYGLFTEKEEHALLKVNFDIMAGSTYLPFYRVIWHSVGLLQAVHINIPIAEGSSSQSMVRGSLEVPETLSFARAKLSL